LKKKEIIKLLLVYGAVHWQLNSFPDPTNQNMIVTKEVRYNDPDAKIHDSQILIIVPKNYPQG
jgi:hypothetical protein